MNIGIHDITLLKIHISFFVIMILFTWAVSIEHLTNSPNEQDYSPFNKNIKSNDRFIVKDKSIFGILM